MDEDVVDDDLDVPAIRELRKRSAAAPPGPWWVDPGEDIGIISAPGSVVVLASPEGRMTDFQFIVAMRNHIDALLNVASSLAECHEWPCPLCLADGDWGHSAECPFVPLGGLRGEL